MYKLVVFAAVLALAVAAPAGPPAATAVLAYSAPVAAPVAVAYAAPAVVPAPVAYHTGYHVAYEVEPVEQHGYSIKY
ncbi:cuticle protein 21-like [Hetaerina americana]|uniref:cuticle protein 21-like n=1 Tax=Hetaerina americana TaxID=62018 RepID=UPI003A7F1856